MELQILKQIENWAGSAVKNGIPLGGDSAAQTRKVILESGKIYFLKYSRQNATFSQEANGLEELRKAEIMRVPEIFLCEDNFLLLEFIESHSERPSSGFFSDFGRQFALLHRKKGETFGFYEDNFIGDSKQLNICSLPESKNWASFYFNKRLLFQYRLAEKNGFDTPELRRLMKGMEERIETILEGSEELPSLLHGDLWSGNFLMDRSGDPCLIDPAVYYGHREADLAMTKLFGGFDKNFYHSYQESFPLPPGYLHRENIYKLYHVLNHLNLFGRSYYSQTISLMQSYL
ncbi:MAG: fructosamine kinase family protein [SAR324 cluster bacterium]|nr:fructosamine kinase family protein [SAR324 cluster bacterium]